MAITTLGASENATDTGETCDWVVDYDSTAQTVGITATGQASVLDVTVTITATSQSYSLDCLNGPAGNILNAGRVVLAGPGSVLGRPQPVTNLPLPPFPKGTVPPYTFTDSWRP